jgi:hypothetical protein
VRYRLPAETPVTWVGEDRLRVGGVVRAVTVPDTQVTHDLIGELRKGATPEHLRRIAKLTPRTAESATDLVAQLVSVCDPAPRRTSRARVVVRAPRSAEAFGRRLAAEFARRGDAVVFAGAEYRPPANTKLVVEVAERVLSPRRYLPLMGDDLAHLIVARDDDGLLLGPLVIPGRTPCLRCDDLHRAEADASWIATATQLHDLPTPRTPEELELVAALLAADSMRGFLSGVDPEPGDARTVVRERITSPARDRLPVEFQVGCGCRVPRGTESDAPQPSRTKAAADPVPA